MSIILILIIMTLVPLRVMASNPRVQPSNLLISKVEELVSSYDSVTLGKHVPLYNIDNEVIAYLFELEPRGYVIINEEGIIVEYSIENNFRATGNDKIYYGGPLKYYRKNETLYMDILSGKSVSKEALSNTITTYKEDTENAQQKLSKDIGETNGIVSTRAGSSYSIPGTTRKYKYNPDGICGSTAAAILLMYYDDYIDSNMVTSQYTTTDGIKLIQYLRPYIDGSQPGSTTSDVVVGLYIYLDSRGLSQQYSSSSVVGFTYAQYTYVIRQDKPAIVGLANHPNLGNHWVVGHGYTIRGSAKYLEINDGHGAIGVVINMDYVDDLIYIY